MDEAFQNAPSTDEGRALAVVDALEGFFHDLEEQDFAAAAALWDPPALFLGDLHVHGPMSLDRLERLFAEAAVFPRDSRASRLSIHRVEWLSARVAQVHATWNGGPWGGVLAGTHTGIFTLRIDELGQPKIRALIALAEGYPRVTQLETADPRQLPSARQISERDSATARPPQEG